MHVEILGFVCGVLTVSVGGVMLLQHIRWKTIHSVYDRDGGRKVARGNALIWPSH